MTSYISNSKNIYFIDRSLAESRTDVRQLIAYVVIRDDSGDVLTYRRGMYSAAPQMLRGARCLGFGGHIQVEDAHNLFGLTDGGVYNSSNREIVEELGPLPHIQLEVCGVINDYSSPPGAQHIALVLQGTLPYPFVDPRTKRERAVNDLRLMKPEELWNEFHEFEFWSQLLINEFWPPLKPRNHAIIRPRRRNNHSKSVVLVGEIASGKTSLARALEDELAFSCVSTREIVSQLIGVPDFRTGSRRDFQEAAARFINTESGPSTLAEQIMKRIGPSNTSVVIDGVRHSQTLDVLRKCIADLVVLFVESPRDKAFNNYRMRRGKLVSLDEFREVRHHPVEEQIAKLRHHADANLFNGGSVRDMVDTFVAWWS